MPKVIRYFPDRRHLQVDLETKGCQLSDDVRTELSPQIEQLSRALEVFPTSHLLLRVIHHPRSNRHHARAALRLPGRTINVDDQHAMVGEAVSRCLTKATRLLDEYLDHPDNEAIEHARRTAELSGSVVAPTTPDFGALGEAYQQNDYAAFRQALFAREEWVRNRIGRWIQRYPELDDEIDRSFKISELEDEVFTAAFEQYARRPQSLTLSEWLDSLIDPAVKSFRKTVADRLEVNAVRFAQASGR